jgi:hypothetical protein
MVLGILWAERIRKKQGLSFYFSRIIATPESDNEEPEERKAAPKDSL